MQLDRGVERIKKRQAANVADEQQTARSSSRTAPSSTRTR